MSCGQMSPLSRHSITTLSRTVQRFHKPLSRKRTLASVVMPFIEDQQAEIRKRQSIHAVLMRSGTSKGLFLHRDDLPASMDKWSPILLAAMGSRNGDKRQLDGVGGATSTTSKVAIVGKSERSDADVDYTFAQVAVGSNKVDMSGNCGNIASGVAPFALDEGLVHAQPGQKEIDVRIYNTNTGRILTSTIQVGDDGFFQEQGDHRISGYNGTGSRIKIKFERPDGSMTGKLFPTGHRQDTITVPSPGLEKEVSVRATLIDAANPFIFVDSSTMPPEYHQLGPAAPSSLELVENIRRAGAVKFGLAANIEAAAQTRSTPKVAILAPPRISEQTEGQERPTDIDVTSFSMGKMHPSLQLTGAVCLGAATGISNTVASDLARETRPIERRSAPGKVDMPQVSEKMDTPAGGEVCIGQRSGQMVAEVRVSPFGTNVEAVTVDRTAQRLFEGNVMLGSVGAL